MRRSATILLLVSLTAVPLASLTVVPLAAAPEKKNRRGVRRNILLITIDSLRADRPAATPKERWTTGAIDALAGRGVRFTRAYTASPSTTPSNATVLTGLYPSGHGLRHDRGGHLAEGVPTLAGALRDAGYTTGGVVGSYHVDSDRGLDRGFGSYGDDIKGLRKLVAGRSRERLAEEVVRLGLAFVDSAPGDRPFFLWLNFHDPHYDYNPPSEFKDRYADDPYAAEVAYLDAQLDALFKGLRSRGLHRRTHIILAGSHGEGLDEHGETGHGIYLFESTIRVPLIVAPAGRGIKRGSTVDRVVSLVDLAPTVLELAGAPAPAGLDGVSLVPLLRRRGGDTPDTADAQPRRIFVEAVQPRHAYGWSPLFAVLEGRRKIVSGQRLEAFVLGADGGESAPVSPAPGWAAFLEAFGRPLLGTLGPPEDERRRILDEARGMDLPWQNSPFCLDKQLWPDPRDADRLALNEALFKARIDLDHGIVGYALTGVQPVLEVDPANFTALEVVIFVALQLRWRDVIPGPLELYQCNYPFRGEPYHYLGHYYEIKDEKEKAAEAYRMFGRLEPWNEEPDYDLATIYASLGRNDESFAHLTKAIALGKTDFEHMRRDPRLAPLWTDPRFAEVFGAPPVTSQEAP